MKFNIITVTYGERFKFLKQVLDSLIDSNSINKIIVIDNGSNEKEKIDLYIQKINKDKNKDLIKLVRHEKNLGSAGGFSSGISEARKYPCDYVMMLDDDNVIESGWEEKIKLNFNLIKSKDKKIILSLNRWNAVGNTQDFKAEDIRREGYLDLNIFDMIKNKIKIKKSKLKNKNFFPIVRTGVCSYGGSLIPYKGILDIDLPKEIFYLYFDDFEYMYRLEMSGYSFYSVYSPKIEDIDSSFSDKSDGVGSFFKSNSSLIKIKYYTRNRILLRRIIGRQSDLSLFLNGLIWSLYQCTSGFTKTNSLSHWYIVTKIFFKSFLEAFFIKI